LAEAVLIVFRKRKRVCTLDQGKHPILACGAESLYLKRQYTSHTAHTKIYKYISRLTVLPVFFILNLSKNTVHRVMLQRQISSYAVSGTFLMKKLLLHKAA